MDFEENIQPDALGAEIQSWVKDYPIDFEIRMTVGIYTLKQKYPRKAYVRQSKFCV